MPQRVDIRTELNMVNWVYTSSGQAPKYTAGYIDSTESGIDPIKYPEHELARPDLQDGADVGPDGAPLGRQRPGDALAVGQLLRSGRHPDHAENYYKRYTMRGNSNFNISKRLTAQANLMLMNEKTVRPRGEGDAEFRALHDTPPTSLAHVSGRHVQLEQERRTTRSRCCASRAT